MNPLLLLDEFDDPPDPALVLLPPDEPELLALLLDPAGIESPTLAETVAIVPAAGALSTVASRFFCAVVTCVCAVIRLACAEAALPEPPDTFVLTATRCSPTLPDRERSEPATRRWSD